MRYWRAMALGLGVVALIALVFSLVQSQRHLRELRAELGRTNEQLVQTTGTISSLKAELDSDQSQLKDREAQVQELTAELEKTGEDADQKVAAEHEASQSQIEALSKAADEANA
jgi:chromosome segregation ATPase